jgi:hypothetical protein
MDSSISRSPARDRGVDLADHMHRRFTMSDAHTHDGLLPHSTAVSPAFWRRLTIAATAISAASMLVFGFWAFAMPESFARFINYPPFNPHLMHDVGAFQIGIGVSVALALVTNDAMLVGLAGFVAASGVHLWSHYMDDALGGNGSDLPVLGLLTLIGAFGLCAHLRGRQS